MNGNARRILLIAGLVSLALVLIFTALFWFGGRDRTTGPTVRSVDNWTVPAGGNVRMQMQLDADKLPVCPINDTVFDAVLVIDRSDSMRSNNALRQATDAAIAFAEAVDNPDSRVGTVIFGSRADILTEIGESPDAIRREAVGLGTGGSTNMGSALNVAGSMFASVTKPNSVKVIILLSDGAPSDGRTGLDAARALKAEGIYLVTVGIRSGGLDPNFLRSIASSAQAYHDVTNLPDLSLLYQELATALGNVAASDVLWEQPYASDQFKISDSDQLPTGIDVIGDRLLWSMPIVTANGAAQDIPLTTTSIGWHDVAGDEGAITFNDCNGAPVSEVLGPGPRVLVSPVSPLWCLLLPLILLVVFMILSLRKRRTGSFLTSVDTSPIPFDFIEKPPPVNWPTGLPQLDSLAGERDKPSYSDALIVGVGKTGRHVLTELRRLLRDQNEGNVPENIRLLAINVALNNDDDLVSAGPSTLTSGKNALTIEESLTLSPDLERVSQRIRSGDANWAHLGWWGNNTSDAPGRAGARMALFDDLMLGQNNSRVWRVMRKRLDGLQKPTVYVVASLARPDEGGMALDLPHFIRQTDGASGIERAIAVFALQRSGSEMSEDLDAARHTYAATRELQRILLRSPYAYNYNPGSSGAGVAGSTETTPLDVCYLIDGKGKTVPGKKDVDLSGKPEDLALYPTISDALLTLLSSEVAPRHGSYLTNMVTGARKVEATLGMPTVSSFSCAVVQYPLVMLKRAVKYRFLFDLIFGGQQGTWPAGFARLDLTGETLKLDSYSGMAGQDPEQRALTFLRQGGEPNRHPLMYSIWQIMEGQSVSEVELYRLRPGNSRIDQAFRLALRDELTLHLNGNTGNSVANRSGKLGSTLAFLEALLEVLRDAEAKVPRQIRLTDYPELRPELSVRLENWRRTVENTLTGVKPWQSTFVSETSAPAAVPDKRRRRRRSREAQHVQASSLYDRYSGELKQAELALAQADVPPLRTLIDYDAEQQQDLYDRYLGPALLDRSGALHPLEQAIERLGWEVVADADDDLVRIRFIIAPPNLGGNEIGEHQNRYGPDQLDGIEAGLDDLAGHYLPLLDKERFERHAKSFGEGRMSADLLVGEPPLLRYERTTIGEVQGATNSHILLALSNDALRRQIEEQIERDPHIVASVDSVASDDPNRAALVGLTDIIPIESVKAIDRASVEYASDALAHVFPAEQAAAELEREWRTRHGETWRFHPRFVRLLDNEELMQSLMLARLYGLLVIENVGGRQQALLSLSPGSPSVAVASSTSLNSYDVLEKAYETSIQGGSDALSCSNWQTSIARLYTEISNQRREYTDLYAFVERKRDETWEKTEQDKASMKTRSTVDRRPLWIQDVDVYDWLLLEQEKRESLRNS